MLLSCIRRTDRAQALRGNSDGWKIHMSGVKHLIQMKGDMSLYSADLRLKLYRYYNSFIHFISSWLILMM